MVRGGALVLSHGAVGQLHRAQRHARRERLLLHEYRHRQQVDWFAEHNVRDRDPKPRGRVHVPVQSEQPHAVPHRAPAARRRPLQRAVHGLRALRPRVVLLQRQRGALGSHVGAGAAARDRRGAARADLRHHAGPAPRPRPPHHLQEQQLHLQALLTMPHRTIDKVNYYVRQRTVAGLSFTHTSPSKITVNRFDNSCHLFTNQKPTQISGNIAAQL